MIAPGLRAAGADALYERARTLLGDLNTVPEPELGRRQYELVAGVLEQARRKDPQAEQADSSLMAEAEIFRKLHERFGEAADRDKAVQLFRTLATDYPSSQWRTEALLTISKLDGLDNAKALAVATAPPVEAAPTAEAAPSNEEAPKTTPVKLAAARAKADSTGDSTPMPGSPPMGQVVRFPEADNGRLTPISAVRHWTGTDYSRVIIEAGAKVSFQYDTVGTPERIFVDLLKTQLAGALLSKQAYTVEDPFLERIRVGRFRSDTVRVVLDLKQAAHFSVGWLENPARFVFELRADAPRARPVELTQADPPPPPAEPVAGKPAAAPQAAVDAVPARETSEPPVALAEDSVPAKDASEEGWQVRPVYAAPALVAEAPAPRPVRFDRAPQAASEQLLSTQRVMAGFGASAPGTSERAEDPATMARAEPPSALRHGELTSAPTPARATSTGRRTLVRALGLKVGRVVIDAGHGGKDPGTIGKTGIQEKDIVLDIAKRLGGLIETELGAEVVLTRADDRFVNRRERTRIANAANADLFVSIHVNSESSRKVRGAETYYLDLTTDPWALSVASRENAGDDMGIGRLQSLVSKIALTEKVHESREFAEQMQSALHKGLNQRGVPDRGVRKAPFTVLIGAEMPSILAEIGFLSNTSDAKLMSSDDERQKIAEHLFHGIAAYSGSLGSVNFAQADKAAKSGTTGLD